MKNQKVRITADSVASAKEKAKAMTPSGLSIRKEKVIRTENQRVSERATADTEEDAFKKAKGRIQSGTEILEEKVVHAPSHKSITTKAPDENTAKASVAKMVDSTASIKSIKLSKHGKSFFGVWKSPNCYTVEVFQPLVVEVTYRPKAEIEVVFGGNKCAKCGRTWDGLERQFAEAKARGTFIYGEGVPVLLYCEKCRKSFCGSCQADLGMDSGCPDCNNPLYAWETGHINL